MSPWKLCDEPDPLTKGPLAVVDIADTLPISRPAVSQHLKVLKDAGLVADRADGTRRIYQARTKDAKTTRRREGNEQPGDRLEKIRRRERVGRAGVQGFHGAIRHVVATHPPHREGRAVHGHPRDRHGPGWEKSRDSVGSSGGWGGILEKYVAGAAAA
jgi:DNA-binding transcriptional ArsR family regulator